MLDFLFSRKKNRSEKELYRRAGLTPIDETDPQDIFIVGYPKSGNTWMQSLVAGIVYGLDPENIPDSLILDLVPDVHFRPGYRRYSTPMYFKSHHLPKPEYRRVIYLVRDGRDVMVSYYHHLKALNGETVDFAEIVRTGKHLTPSKWHEHVNAWRANPFQAEMLTLRYEDLLENPVSELRRLCDFADLQRSDALLEDVSRKTSFAQMRQREEKSDWANSDWPKSSFFVRRGVAGSYRDEMPAHVLSSFLGQAEETLRLCHYT